jgi:hypothetical protein
MGVSRSHDRNHVTQRRPMSVVLYSRWYKVILKSRNITASNPLTSLHFSSPCKKARNKHGNPSKGESCPYRRPVGGLRIPGYPPFPWGPMGLAPSVRIFWTRNMPLSWRRLVAENWDSMEVFRLKRAGQWSTLVWDAVWYRLSCLQCANLNVCVRFVRCYRAVTRACSKDCKV